MLKKSNKKGQYTLFIILGIIIILTIVILFAFKSHISEIYHDFIYKDNSKYEDYFKECIIDVSENILAISGATGGSMSSDIQPLQYEDGEMIGIIDKNNFKFNLEKAISEKLIVCFNIDDPFINIRDPKVEIEIGDKTIITVENLYEYQKEDTYLVSRPLIVEIDVRLGRLHDIAYEYSKAYVQTPASFHDFQDENINLDILDYDTGKLLLVFTDNQSILDGMPFKYMILIEP